MNRTPPLPVSDTAVLVHDTVLFVSLWWHFPAHFPLGNPMGSSSFKNILIQKMTTSLIDFGEIFLRFRLTFALCIAVTIKVMLPYRFPLLSWLLKELLPFHWFIKYGLVSERCPFSTNTYQCIVSFLNRYSWNISILCQTKNKCSICK